MATEPLTFISLCAGIGGIDKGLEDAGMRCVAQVEIDPWCQRILAKHWPDVPKFSDLTTVTGGELGSADVIAGGFPCQPVSHAGKRKGEDDERWLWDSFARVIAEVRPTYVVIENVPGLLSKGGCRVVLDLDCLGYDAEWESIPAAALGAPHRRDRVWIVAYARGQRLGDAGSCDQGEGQRQPASSHTGEDPSSWLERREKLKAKGINGNGAGMPLGIAVRLWTSTRASEWRGTGPIGSSSHNHRLNRGYLDATVQERTGVSGRLNPEWVEWLQGFPAQWTALED